MNQPQPIVSNPAGHAQDQARLGGEYAPVKNPFVVPALATAHWSGDLLGTKTKTFTFVNSGVDALVGGNLIQASPNDADWETVGGTAFDALAGGGGVASETFEGAHRYWRVILVGGADSTGSLFVHTNNY